MFFSHELSVGNRVIDSEHQKLHDIINRLASVIAAGEDAALSESFELLENGLSTYLVVEENIAQSINFDFTQHKLAHQNLLKRFQRVQDDLMANNNRLSKFEKKDCIAYLMDCLIQHIKEDDRPFKVELNNRFYDYKPN